MELIKLTKEEARDYVRYLERLSKVELLSLYTEQIYLGIFHQIQMKAVQPKMSGSMIIRDDSRFVPVENEHYQLEDENRLLHKYLLDKRMI